ncbi:MAG TPA: alkaline phosphatase PhoX [Gemmatimonadales bacterium]
MRTLQYLLISLAVSSVAACDKSAETVASPTPGAAAELDFVTTQPAQATALVPSALLKPIITVGDPIPGAQSNPDPELRVWAPIPDGLGAYAQGDELVLHANHEMSGTGVNGKFRYARVSRLVIDMSSLSVKSGSYPVTGSSLLERLCSATWVTADEGFGQGYFLSGEEATNGAKNGVTITVSRSGTTTELPWLGHYAHENTISVAGFDDGVVILGTDDNAGASELYMYIAASSADVLAGGGKLYAFTSDDVTHSGNLQEGQTVGGQFLEIANPSQPSAGLQAAADNLGSRGALPFVRLEDLDYDKGAAKQGPVSVYMVDTGSETVNGRVAGKVNAQCNAPPCDPYGSIYRVDLDPQSPTQNARLTLLDRSSGVAAGDWASPDNIAVGKKSLMVQEDPAYSGFNRAARIWQFKLHGHDKLGKGTAVVEVNNPGCGVGCWESSGIIDASRWLGEGTWLFDVQAHGLPVPSQGLTGEGGQLLYLRLPGS